MHRFDHQPETATTPERKKTDTFAAPGNVFDAVLDRRLREQTDADATDEAPTDGPWWYWLADVDTSGRETFHGPVSTFVEATAQPHRAYLPLVAKGEGNKGAKLQGKKIPSAQLRTTQYDK